MPTDTLAAQLTAAPALVTPNIVLDNITVMFGSTTALDNVTLELAPGVRHAVVGENGAGKSTLMRVLFGLVRPDSGQIVVDGQRRDFATPADAIALGIGMVHQHFELIGSFTVAENIILGAESVGFLNRKAAEVRVRDLADRSGLAIDPAARVETLSVAARQRVEILKALYRNARVLILDEPTAVLAPTEARDLWHAVESLSASGVTIVFITHKLDDVMAQAQQVTVLRRGQRVLSQSVSDSNPRILASAMIGSEVALAAETRPGATGGEIGNLVLSIQKLTVPGTRGEKAVENVSLEVRAGEILALVGVDGSGQSELIEAIMGLRRVASGQICLHGQDISALPVAKRRLSGIGYIPDDRHYRAQILPFTCAENSVLGRQSEPIFDRWGWIRHNARAAFFRERSTAFDVRGASANLPVSSLSGGNQQKLVLARELSRRPDVLIAAQPTRGLDFAAAAFVHAALRAERDRGAAVLLQSLDLAESLSLADRVAVLFAGRIVAVLTKADATEENIGVLMTGAARG